MNPEVNSIIFELLDEIIEAFQADAFHVGMDEVFLLGSELSPSTKGMVSPVIESMVNASGKSARRVSDTTVESGCCACNKLLAETVSKMMKSILTGS